MENIQRVLEKIENSSIFSNIEIVEDVELFHSRSNRKINGYKISMISDWEDKDLVGLDITRDIEDFEYTPFCNAKEEWETAYNTYESSVLFATDFYQDSYGYDVYKLQVSKAIKYTHTGTDTEEYIFCIENITDIESV